MLPGDPAFPEQLAPAAGGPRATETFGLGPSLVALALTTYGVFLLADPLRKTPGAGEWAVLAVLFGAAAGCVGHEVRRRTRRAVLVGGDLGVGVYRNGKLRGVLTKNDLRASRAAQVGSIRGMVALAFLGVAFLWYGATQEGDLVSRALGVVPGLCLVLLTLSFMRTLWLCQAFHLPGSRSKALFAESELERIEGPE